MYKLWTVTYYEAYAGKIETNFEFQNYIFCQSKTKLIEEINKVLDKDENIEDIAILKPIEQNQT